jgi:hypothetical protein
MASQLVASRVVLSSVELVGYLVNFPVDNIVMYSSGDVICFL